MFTLRWPSGALVGMYCGDSVERFCQFLDEGLIDGVPAVGEPGELEHVHYELAWGTTILRDMSRFCEYGMPHKAEITLVRTKNFDPNEAEAEVATNP